MMDHFAPAQPAGAIDLAAVADFRLGILRVQPSLRRVGSGTREESVEPRVMQALIALAEAAGAVVSRDALIDRCWGGRIVGDDAINRCIAKVRRLAETTEPPAFTIETVAKVGYRLKLPVTAAWEPAAIGVPTPEQPDSTPARPKGSAGRARVWLVLVVLALTITAGAAAGFWQLQSRLKWTVQSSRLFLPNLDGETNPRLSPDGSMLAYAANALSGHGRIYVGKLEGGTPLPVSSPDDNAGSPAWASDNVHLAYVVTGSPGMPCRIMVATVPDGVPHLAGRCRQSPTTEIAWQPGTHYIFLTDRIPLLEGQLTGFFEVIFRLNIDTGRSEQVTTPATSEADAAPRVSPDGEWLAYIRGRGLTGQTLRLRKLTSNEEREITCDPTVHAVDWSPDSRSLIAAIAGPSGDDIFAYPIDGGAGYRVYASPLTIVRLATGPNGALTAEVQEARTDLARAGTTPHPSADVIDPAAGLTDWPDFAPDGTLAFVSNRSGKIALWTRKPGRQPDELPSTGLNDIERPVWSPDGSRIAFFEAGGGKITVHVVTALGQEIVSFDVPSIGYGLPNWTPDGEHLVMFDKRILQVVRIDLRDPSRREPVQDKLWVGTAYYHGATYSSSGTTPGLWQMDGAPRLVTPNYPIERQPRFTFMGDDVLLAESRESGNLRILAQPLNGAPSRLAYYAPAAEADTPLAVNPLTGDVIYVSEVAVASHIHVLTIARQ